jgi:hypothetical protein
MDVAAEDAVAARREAKEEQDVLAEAGVTTRGTEEQIIGDKQSKTFYPSDCPRAKEIAEADKVIFKTRADAEKAGFKLAKNCH